ncbi:mucin-5AC-like [Haliotis rubra]|uniref:mucin-5AC-like n=1 Tax=Haliotis rubra TaxID=36100 RepID=UPI001EE59F2A|nr:mucin-5AC-like [Haliotis rubra]
MGARCGDLRLSCFVLVDIALIVQVLAISTPLPSGNTTSSNTSISVINYSTSEREHYQQYHMCLLKQVPHVSTKTVHYSSSSSLDLNTTSSNGNISSSNGNISSSNGNTSSSNGNTSSSNGNISRDASGTSPTDIYKTIYGAKVPDKRQTTHNQTVYCEAYGAVVYNEKSVFQTTSVTYSQIICANSTVPMVLLNSTSENFYLLTAYFPYSHALLKLEVNPCVLDGPYNISGSSLLKYNLTVSMLWSDGRATGADIVCLVTPPTTTTPTTTTTTPTTTTPTTTTTTPTTTTTTPTTTTTTPTTTTTTPTTTPTTTTTTPTTTTTTPTTTTTTPTTTTTTPTTTTTTPTTTTTTPTTTTTTPTTTTTTTTAPTTTTTTPTTTSHDHSHQRQPTTTAPTTTTTTTTTTPTTTTTTPTTTTTTPTTTTTTPTTTTTTPTTTTTTPTTTTTTPTTTTTAPTTTTTTPTTTTTTPATTTTAPADHHNASHDHHNASHDHHNANHDHHNANHDHHNANHDHPQRQPRPPQRQRPPPATPPRPPPQRQPRPPQRQPRPPTTTPTTTTTTPATTTTTPTTTTTTPTTTTTTPPPRPPQSHQGQKATSSITLDVVNVLGQSIAGPIPLARKVQLLATASGASSEQGLRPVACDAVSADGHRYSVLRAGCGDGIIFAKNQGFTTKGLQAFSPYFKTFKIRKDSSLKFECNFTLCDSVCDGNSCNRRRKRSADSFLAEVPSPIMDLQPSNTPSREWLVLHVACIACFVMVMSQIVILVLLFFRRHNG